MTSSFFILKALHVTGVVVFLGNIIVTAWWKMAADRTRDPAVIAYAQRQVTVTDFIFTAAGAALIVGAGDAMAYGYYSDSWAVPWIFWGRVLFFSVGAIWLFVLIPITGLASATGARVCAWRCNSTTLLGAWANLDRRRPRGDCRPARGALDHDNETHVRSAVVHQEKQQ
jgi:uncharacterized membrane protein